MSRNPWGLLVIGYMFFGVIGTGISTYNTLYEIFNKDHRENNPFERVKLRNEWIAFAVLIPGFIMVFASAYKPAEAAYIYLNLQGHLKDSLERCPLRPGRHRHNS